MHTRPKVVTPAEGEGHVKITGLAAEIVIKCSAPEAFDDRLELGGRAGIDTLDGHLTASGWTRIDDPDGLCYLAPGPDGDDIEIRPSQAAVDDIIAGVEAILHAIDIAVWGDPRLTGPIVAGYGGHAEKAYWTVDQVEDALKARGYGPGRNHRWRCPAHDGDSPDSLSVTRGDNDAAKVKCHSRDCATVDVLTAIGLTPGGSRPDSHRLPAPRQPRRTTSPAKTAAAAPHATKAKRDPSTLTRTPFDHEWAYVRPDGTVWALVRRWDATEEFEKAIRPFDPRTGKYKLPEGEQRCLYAPDPIDGHDVLIVEGEKCVDHARTLGYTAVCWLGGTGGVKASIADGAFDVLATANSVTVWPDNDSDHNQGREAMAHIIQHLDSIGVNTAAVIGVTGCHDIADWDGTNPAIHHEATGTDAVTAWAAAQTNPPLAAADLADPAAGTVTRNGRVVIMTGGQSADIAAAALCVAGSAYSDDGAPRIAYMGGVLHRFAASGGRIDAAPLDAPALDAELGALVHWARVGTKGDIVDSTVTARTLNLALRFAGPDRIRELAPEGATPPPAITSIAYAPFIRADGTVCQTIGIDEASGVLLHPTIVLHQPIPEHPTQEQAQTSAAWLQRELLDDFPLESEADRANAFAYMLTPGNRQGGHVAPLSDHDASTPGSGKGLMTDMVATIWTGKGAGSVLLTNSNEENKKLITSIFAGGYTVVRFDECVELRGSALQKLATDLVWTDRILGVNVTVDYENTITWAATGNNKQVVGDMVRRVLRIRYVPRESCPWLRADFKHPDILEWVGANRAEILYHILIVCRSWYAAGKPMPADPPAMGSYGKWAATMAGILSYAGIEGFLQNRGEIEDADHSDVEDFLAAIADCWTDAAPFTCKEVVTATEKLIVAAHQNVKEAIPHSVRAQSDKSGPAKALGVWCEHHRDRRFGRYQLVKGGKGHGNVRQWSVIVHPAPIETPTIETVQAPAHDERLAAPTIEDAPIEADDELIVSPF